MTMMMVMIFSHEGDAHNGRHYHNDQNDGKDNNVDDDDDDIFT